MEKKSVLDVKTRRRARKWDRLRRGLFALTFAALAVALLYLSVRTYLVLFEKAVRDNPAFDIRAQASTDGPWVSTRQILEWAGVDPTENLLLLDITRMDHDLSLVPNLREVSIERIPPNLLRIHAPQRVPVFRLQYSLTRETGEVRLVTYCLDAEGVVFPPLDSQWRNRDLRRILMDLPFITGLPPDTIRMGRPVEFDGLEDAVRFIHAFERSPMKDLAAIDSIDVAKSEVLEATTRAASKITFGRTGFPHQLLRWREVHLRAAAERLLLDTLDLSFENRCPATWAEPLENNRHPEARVRPGARERDAY